MTGYQRYFPGKDKNRCRAWGEVSAAENSGSDDDPGQGTIKIVDFASRSRF